jgi:hypothetical protein
MIGIEPAPGDHKSDFKGMDFITNSTVKQL